MQDSDAYRARKDFYDSLLTIFGRKPVLEALEDPQIAPYRLHLADTNKHSEALRRMIKLAEQKGAEVVFHNRDALSRISKNRRQDQGVVLDIQAPNFQTADALNPEQHPQIIALENVTNPQNVGMTIRSVGASPSDGLLLPRKGNAPLDALVIKSSAGTLFKTPIFHCQQLSDVLPQLRQQGYRVYGLSGLGQLELQQLPHAEPVVFILGNETHGISTEIAELCDDLVKIPMSKGIESLNVSVAAALVAFRGLF